jgi:hypothetical protein
LAPNLESKVRFRLRYAALLLFYYIDAPVVMILLPLV